MKKILFSILVFLGITLTCIADEYIKQPNNFTCAPTTSYNLIKRFCPECSTSVRDLAKMQKTSTMGTSIFNLCSGLEEYFSSQGKNVKIKYFGRFNVFKYKVNPRVDFNLIKNCLRYKGLVIISIGMYDENPDGSLIRRWGHVVNVVSVKDNIITVFDPDDRKNEFTNWEVNRHNNVVLVGGRKSPQRIKPSGYYFVDKGLDHLVKDKKIIIDGLILVWILDYK